MNFDEQIAELHRGTSEVLTAAEAGVDGDALEAVAPAILGQLTLPPTPLA